MKPRLTPIPLATLAILAPLAIPVACGREDIELAGVDGGDGATTSPTGLPPGLTDAAVEGAACADASTRACRSLGEACRTSTECCTGRCEGGTCLPAGTCRPADHACGGGGECCSGRCEPIPGTTNRGCAPLCAAAGASCARATDCCTLACVGGRCAEPGATCIANGRDCSTPAECCSNRCEDGKCRLDPVALCRPSGEECTSGGGAPCCSGLCVDDRCDPGAGACRPRGAPCAADRDCCLGACVPSASRVRICSAPCIADEAGPCSNGADCCSGACTLAEGGRCSRGGTLACALVGQACETGATCCTGVCLDRRCADNCPTVH